MIYIKNHIICQVYQTMPKKRIRIITKKQKITETNASQKVTSLEQTIREPSFLPGRTRRPSLPLALPFNSSIAEQKIASQRPEQKETESTDAPNREAFSYDHPGGTVRNDGTYRIAGTSDQKDTQLYRSVGEQRIEKDREERFNPLGSTDTNRLRDNDTLSKQKQDRYQGASQTYKSSSSEKKNSKELERSRF